MKNGFWLIITVLVGFGSLSMKVPDFVDTKPAVSAPADGIQFTEASWKEILKKAKAEKKVIFLDAYASWCQPCKLLQKNVFTKRAVGELYNAKFINVKMDMEKGEGPALTQIYPLEAYPTLLFIDGNGRVLRKVIGFKSPDDMIAIGRSIRPAESYGRVGGL